MDALISPKFTSKKTETHLKFVLPFSAMLYTSQVTGHLILQKKNTTRTPRKFENKICNFSHQNIKYIFRK